MRNYLLLLIFFTFYSQIASSRDIVSDPPAIKGVKELRILENSSVPNYVQFESGHELKVDEVNQWLHDHFRIDASSALVYANEQTDELGMLHIRFTQRIHGYDVANTMYILHCRNGYVRSMNGYLVSGYPDEEIALTPEAAFDLAIGFVQSDVYMWELESEENRLKFETGNPSATWMPMANLVYASPENNYNSTAYTLCYHFDVYASIPLSRQDIYVNASTGSIHRVDNKIHTTDSLGLAITKYSGSRVIVADHTGTNAFRLRETGRGNGIQTYDMNEGTSYGSAVDFTDTDNYWNNVNSDIDEAATDAHWGAEMTYDYFHQKHNRNSIDGNGFTLRSYVHYDANYSNAFWDGQRMTYGDGNGGSTGPFTALDIAGHEITHGLTSFTADLIYSYESGALNESFSDIFGAAIEFFAKPASANWLLGENIGITIRSISNPNSKNDPDTYQGQYWYSGSGDNGGVHTNSGVQNFWFYLLTAGGTGTNDNNQVYTVPALGIDKAAKIAFRNLTVYLYPSAQYADARYYAIKSAIDLYGACTPEVMATTNAWYAVGVGPMYSANATVDFAASTLTSCTGEIQFENLTTGSAISWNWNFGDGSSSTQFNPQHQYASNGTYTVKLLAATCAGFDSTIKTAYVTINKPAAPAIAGNVICDSGTTILSASGPGTIHWYDIPVGGNLIDTGHTFATPFLSNTTTYYAEEHHVPPSQYTAAPNNNFGTGGYFSGDHRWLIFDCYTPLTLVSVQVYGGSAGNRTIELRNSSGTVLQSKTVYIPGGSSRVTLNFDVPVGTDLELAINGTADLYRNSSGPSYPYTLSGKLSVKYSNATSPTSYYYFFYDWEVKDETCISERSPVIAEVVSSPNPTITMNGSPELCEGSTLLLTADVGKSFAWSTGDTTQSISVSTSGNYSVSVIDSNGCSGVSQVVNISTVPAPVAGFTSTGNSWQVQFQNTSLYGSTWYWDFGDGNTSVLEHPTHQFQASGAYQVMLIAINGDCRDTVFATIGVFGSGGLSSPLDHGISIFPNPVDELLTVRIAHPKEDNISMLVLNVLGQMIKHIETNGDGKQRYYHIPVDDLPAGSYFIKVISGQQTFSGKFIKTGE